MTAGCTGVHGEGAPALGMTGLTSGSVAGMASNSAVDIGTGVDAVESMPNANATDLFDGSTSERWPPQMTYVLLLWRAKIASDIANGAERWPTCSGPAIAVTTGCSAAEAVGVALGAVSHTAQSDCKPVRIGICVGAPTIPTIGPCGYLLSSAALTKVGRESSPAMRRALTRFSAGCSRPSTST